MLVGGMYLTTTSSPWGNGELVRASAALDSALDQYAERCDVELDRVRKSISLKRGETWPNFGARLTQRVQTLSCVVYLMESKGGQVWSGGAKSWAWWGEGLGLLHTRLVEQKLQARVRPLIMSSVAGEYTVEVYAWRIFPVSRRVPRTRWGRAEEQIVFWDLNRSDRPSDRSLKKLITIEATLRADRRATGASFGGFGLLMLGLSLLALWRGKRLERRRIEDEQAEIERARVRVFMSYRWKDEPALGDRIYGALAEQFGHDYVFRDKNSIEQGSDYIEAIEQWLPIAEVVLILIGPRWLETARRETPETDNVFKEIRWALQHDKTILSVQLGGRDRIPKASELPEEIQEICRINATTVRNDPDFEGDMSELIKTIRELRT
jgi:hypothetical protein